MKKLVITIDGPAGVGKSTVSKLLARRLNYTYLDTGALYRAIAYKADKEEVAPDDELALAELCGRTVIVLKNEGGCLAVQVDGANVTDEIRTEQISLLASAVSALPAVRNALLFIQRRAGAEGGVVAEGRDMGTIVFPEADIKFFLDAKIEERVRRRFGEIDSRKVLADVQTIEKDMIRRDKQDRERPTAPLRAAEDAIVIDSSEMSAADVVERMLSIIKACKG